jgi:glycosyltransferase involved in cell wall biosynthesis
MKRDLVLFSPLPPQRNGIADYTATFIDDIADQFNLYVIVDDNELIEDHRNVTTLRYAEYAHYAKAFSKTGHAYQIGNNSKHHYMLPVLGRHPGLTTIHDLSLQHMVGEALPGGVRGESYFDLMFESYGSEGVEIASDVFRWNSRSPVIHTELGMLPAIVRRSLGLVTHSMLGALRVKACGYDKPIHRIDHHCQRQCDPLRANRSASKAKARAALGFPARATILLSLGFVYHAKKIDLTLEALALLRREHRDFIFVIAGESDPARYDLHADIARLGLQDIVIVHDYVPEADLLAYLAACDVLVNLRHPTMGESSGTLANGLGVGCCAVVTDTGTFSEIPDDSVIKIALEDMNALGIARHILPLIAFPETRKRYEENAARYAESRLSQDLFVSRYVEAIEKTLFERTSGTPGSEVQVTRRYLPASSRLNVEALAAACRHETGIHATMWWRELLLPLGEPQARMLIIGGTLSTSELARRAFEWMDTIDHLDHITDVTAAMTERYDAVLIITDFDAFLRHPYGSVQPASRALKQGGTLVFNLINADTADIRRLFDGDDLIDSDSLAGRPWPDHRSPLCSMLESSGIRIEVLKESFNEITTLVSSDIFPAEIAVRGRKVSENMIRYGSAPLLRY